MDKKGWEAPHTLISFLTLEKVALEQKKKELEEKLVRANNQLQQQLRMLEKADTHGK